MELIDESYNAKYSLTMYFSRLKLNKWSYLKIFSNIRYRLQKYAFLI